MNGPGPHSLLNMEIWWTTSCSILERPCESTNNYTFREIVGKQILCDQSVFSPFFYFLFLSFSIEKEVEKSSVVSEQEGHSVAWKICWWVLKIQFLKIILTIYQFQMSKPRTLICVPSKHAKKCIHENIPLFLLTIVFVSALGQGWGKGKPVR